MKTYMKPLARIFSVLIILPLFFGFLAVEEKYQEKAALSQVFLSDTMGVLDKVGVVFNVTSLQSQVTALQTTVERFQDGTVTVLEFYQFTQEASLVFRDIMEKLAPLMTQLNSLADWGDTLGSSSVSNLTSQYHGLVAGLEETQVALENYVLYTQILGGVVIVSVLLGLCGFTFFPMFASVLTLGYAFYTTEFFNVMLEDIVFTIHPVAFVSVFSGFFVFIVGFLGRKKQIRKMVS